MYKDYGVSDSFEKIHQAMLDVYPIAIEQTKEIAKKLYSIDPTQTARNIWHYVKSNVKYQEDGERDQVVKGPKYLIGSTGDCKSFAVTTAAIAFNCGLDPSFKFAWYDVENPNSNHVYVVSKGGIIDATYTLPLQEPPNYYKSEIIMPKVIATAGAQVGAQLTPEQFFEKYKDEVSKITEKIVNGKLTNTAANVYNVLFYIPWAPGRYVSLVAISMNYKGLATAMRKANASQTKQFLLMWKVLGGKESTLLNAIRIGEKKPIANGWETIKAAAKLKSNYEQFKTGASEVVLSTVGVSEGAVTLFAWLTLLLPTINLLLSNGTFGKSGGNALSDSELTLNDSDSTTPDKTDNTALIIGSAAVLFLILSN